MYSYGGRQWLEDGRERIVCNMMREVGCIEYSSGVYMLSKQPFTPPSTTTIHNHHHHQPFINKKGYPIDEDHNQTINHRPQHDAFSSSPAAAAASQLFVAIDHPIIMMKTLHNIFITIYKKKDTTCT